MSPRATRLLVAIALSAPLAWVARAHADGIVPPWGDPHDVPLPSWGRSVAPLRVDVPIAAAPGTPDAKRGTIEAGARLPLYGTARGGSCGGRWLLVGPMAWVCSDAAEVSRDAPAAPPPSSEAGGAPAEGLPYRYFFVGADGAEAFLNLPKPSDDPRAVEAPDEALDPGFSVAIVEETTARGALWGRTRQGKWIPMRELTPYRVSGFHGDASKSAIENGKSDGKGSVLDAAWVVSDVANVFSAPAATGKPTGRRARFDRLTWHEERAAAHGGGAMVRISDDGVAPEQWVRARDIAHATLSAPPDEIGGAHATERWIDIDVGAQTLVAYEGTRPVFATLVSTGRAPVGDVAATPAGVHRIGAKLTMHDMDALEPDLDDPSAADADTLDDVPYVQYFDQGVALVGAFWHRDLGRPHGRTSVSLAPRDAAWLFAFTAPHLPTGWSSAYPTELDPGSVVRVRAGEAVPRDFPLDKPDGTATHKSSSSFSSPAETP